MTHGWLEDDDYPNGRLPMNPEETAQVDAELLDDLADEFDADAWRDVAAGMPNADDASAILEAAELFRTILPEAARLLRGDD